MRCSICDYTKENGSPLLDKEPSRDIDLIWSHEHQGYHCTSCLNEIQDNLQDLTPEEEEWENLEDYLAKYGAGEVTPEPSDVP